MEQHAAGQVRLLTDDTAELTRAGDPSSAEVHVSVVEEAPPAEPVEVTSDAVERALAWLWVVPFLLVIAALWLGQVLLIPIVLSVLAAYALEPFVAFLEGWHIPRIIAVPLVMTAILGGVGGTMYALRGEAVAFVDRIPTALHTVSQGIQGASRGTAGTPGTVAKMQEAARELETATTPATKRPNDGVTAVRVEEPTFRWSTWLWSGSRSALEFAAQMFAVVCLTYLLLATGDLYRRKLIRIVPTFSDKRVTVQILTEIDRQIERFLVTRIAISAIVGAVIWVTFRLVGLENAGVWAILTALLYAVPVAGPIVAVSTSAVAAFVQFGSIGMASVVGGLGALIGMLEGYALTPALMARVGQMNAVAVFVSLLFWGWIWGIWGLLLAVPITAALKAVCERVPNLSSIAELLRE